MCEGDRGTTGRYDGRLKVPKTKSLLSVNDANEKCSN